MPYPVGMLTRLVRLPTVYDGDGDPASGILHIQASSPMEWAPTRELVLQSAIDLPLVMGTVSVQLPIVQEGLESLDGRPVVTFTYSALLSVSADAESLRQHDFTLLISASGAEYILDSYDDSVAGTVVGIPVLVVGPEGPSGPTGAAGEGYTRESLAYESASLAAGAQQVGVLTLAPSYRLLQIVASRQCRLRLYDTIAHRDADLTRPKTIDIDPLLDHGLMLDLAMETGTLTRTLSPLVDGAILGGGDSAAFTLDNLDTVTGTVELTLAWVRTES